METIGLVGGLSPYSTILYYRLLVERARERTGRDPELVIVSVSIDRVSSLVRSWDLEGLAGLLADALGRLAAAGARVVGIAANTPHIALPLLRGRLPEGVRLVSIVEAVTRRVAGLGVKRIGLLATGATVRSRLYHEALGRIGVEVVAPPPRLQEMLDNAIRLVSRGLLDERRGLLVGQLVGSLLARGAEALVLGCTELPLLLGGLRVRVPIVDSLEEHVEALLAEAGAPRGEGEKQGLAAGEPLRQAVDDGYEYDAEGYRHAPGQPR